jgi:hypothetical protein
MKVAVASVLRAAEYSPRIQSISLYASTVALVL